MRSSARRLTHFPLLRYNRGHRTVDCACLHDHVSGHLYAIEGIAVETYNRLRAVRELELDPHEFAPLPVVSLWRVMFHSLTGLVAGLLRIPTR